MRQRRTTNSLAFIHEGRTFMVDLAAPMPVWREGKRAVRLIDLWVAAMLPGDVFDTRFTLVTSGTAPGAVSIDGLSFARGYVAVASHALFWPEGENRPLIGCRVRAIVAHGCVVGTEAEPTPAPQPGNATPAVDLIRLLPILSAPYPIVTWRVAGAAVSDPGASGHLQPL